MIPRILFGSSTICFADGEAEGWCLSIEWFGLVFEFSVARRERWLP